MSNAERRMKELVKLSKEAPTEEERTRAKNQLRELSAHWPSNREVRVAGSANLR